MNNFSKRISKYFTEVWSYPMEQTEIAGNLLKALKKYIETFDNDEFKRYASESGGITPHTAQQLYDAVAKQFRIPGPLYGADSLCFSKKNFSTTVYIEPPEKSGMKNYLVIQDTGEGNDVLNECETLEEAESWCKKCGHTIIPYESRKKNFSKSQNEVFADLARSIGVPVKEVWIQAATPDDKIFPRDYDIYNFMIDNKFGFGQYYKDGRWYTNTRSSDPANKKITDALNKEYPGGPDDYLKKNFGSNYEKLTLYINDPDNHIKDMLKLVSRNSIVGHSFDVVVDPDMKDSSDGFYGKFNIDGDGSDKIKFEDDILFK